jgi:hypothetical protein
MDTEGRSPEAIAGEIIERLGDCLDFRGHHTQRGRENGTVPFDPTAEDMA